MRMRLLSGVSYPFRIEKNGLPAPAKGIEVIRSALVVLLKTRKRSRVFRPDLGPDLHRLLFENTGPVLESLIRREIISAVNNYLPEVQILKIDTNTVEKTVYVNIIYASQGVTDETGFIGIGSSMEDVA